MADPIDTLDLTSLRLSPGEGRRLDLAVPIDPFTLGADSYAVTPPAPAARVDVSRTTGPGYALRLRFAATLHGPCMRCLAPAAARYEVDAREVAQPGGGEELDSPYVQGGTLDLRGWARDSLALQLPRAILCREDCAGLCTICGADLNAAGPEHRHDPAPDPRWSKLSEIRFE